MNSDIYYEILQCLEFAQLNAFARACKLFANIVKNNKLDLIHKFGNLLTFKDEGWMSYINTYNGIGDLIHGVCISRRKDINISSFKDEVMVYKKLCELYDRNSVDDTGLKFFTVKDFEPFIDHVGKKYRYFENDIQCGLSFSLGYEYFPSPRKPAKFIQKVIITVWNEDQRLVKYQIMPYSAMVTTYYEEDGMQIKSRQYTDKVDGVVKIIDGYRIEE